MISRTRLALLTTRSTALASFAPLRQRLVPPADLRQGAYLWVPGPLGGGERLRSSDGEVGAPPALGRHHVVYLQRPPTPNTIGCRCSSARRGAAPEPAVINAQTDSQELLEPVALQVQQPRSVRASMRQWRSPPRHQHAYSICLSIVTATPNDLQRDSVSAGARGAFFLEIG